MGAAVYSQNTLNSSCSVISLYILTISTVTISFVNRYLFRTLSRWEIPSQQINLRSVLGSGTFGEVWKAVVWGLNGYPGHATVAVKKLKREKLFFSMTVLNGSFV